MAERDADGQLIVVARSTSLWDSDMPIPASLPDRLAASAGDSLEKSIERL